VHGAPPEQMDVEMVDGLTAILTGVDHEAVAFWQIFGARDVGCSPQQVAEQAAVFCFAFGN